MSLQALKEAVEGAETPSLWRYKIAYTGGRVDRARPVVMETEGAQAPAAFFVEVVKECIAALGEELVNSPDCIVGEGQCIVQDVGDNTTQRVEEADVPVADNAISNLKDLQNAKYYCVKFNCGGNSVYAFKWIGATWSKKNTGINSFYLKEGALKQLEEDHSFRVTKSFDAIVFGGKEFIVNQGMYSKIFDYKEDLEDVATTACGEFVELGVVTDSEKIREYVGHNALRLKRLAAVVDRGFYKDPVFMRNLHENNEEMKFNFAFEGGRIVPQGDKISELLTALGDRRLNSLNSGNMYDANSTQVVE